MNTAKELQAKIISLISGITDVKKLTAIHVDLQAEKKENESVADAQKLPWEGLAVEMREATTFEYLIKTQGEKKISYDEVRELADNIDWEQSTEELLEMLD